MFNNCLADAEAKQEIKRRALEAETYSLHKRLGYGDAKAARWVFALILLIDGSAGTWPALKQVC